MTGHKAVVLFYRYFVPSQVPDTFTRNPEFHVDRLEQFQHGLCEELGCKGRILLAAEGINGTLSGKTEGVIDEYISRMKSFHLLRDGGTPGGPQPTEAELADELNFLFRDVDWKRSKVAEDSIEPFPDLKISIVKEIVSTGGIVKVDEIPEATGKHLSPKEFHQAMLEGEKPVVLIDVRNTFEYDIGHFVLPTTGAAAMNPEMVTFSSFDSKFCAEQAGFLKDKKVLMYCTGGKSYCSADTERVTISFGPDLRSLTFAYARNPMREGICHVAKPRCRRCLSVERWNTSLSGRVWR
jgi:UPF0176 protein